MATPVRVGIIGGTGLDDANIIPDAVEKFVDTPFGKPSDALKFGTIDGVPCILLSRHGRKHTISPTMINYRANIWALKQHGCTHILVSTACGSLQEEVKPGNIVFLDQFIDRTRTRATSFYDSTPGGPLGVCHIPMDDPFCPETRKILIDVATELGIFHHPTCTGVCIEGPRFSTKAESRLFRQWNAHVVNMTTVPEVCLAKELGMSYAAIALPTDYDCWHEDKEPVTVEAVMDCFHKNSEKACNIIRAALKRIYSIDWTETMKKNKELARSAVMLPTGMKNDDAAFPHL